MMILKMLEQGKISAEEASRLLASAGGEKAKTENVKVKSENCEYRGNSNNNNNNNNYNKANYNTSNKQNAYSDFTSDFTKKFETFARDIEPKIHKITEVIAEKTTSVADMISKSISDSTADKSYQKPSKPSSSTSIYFESIISPGNNELSLSGLNGEISLKGYNGDKLSGNIFYKSKKFDAPIKFMKMGNKYFVDYDEDNFDKVCIDVLIPEKMFKNVSVQTISGPISLETLQCNSLHVNNSNASIFLKSIVSENIHVEGNNGKLLIKNVFSTDASFENFGGDVECVEMDISKMKLNTFNAPIVIYMSNFAMYNDYMWLIEGSNGKLKLNLPTMEEIGYHIKASTSLSNVKIGLTGLSFITNNTNYAEAKSIKYDSASKIVKLSLETSNAPLIVN